MLCFSQNNKVETSVVELPFQYTKELLSQTNKYQFATNKLSVLYTKYPTLASDLTIITIKSDIQNKDKYIQLHNTLNNRKFDTNLLITNKLESHSIKRSSSLTTMSIQIQLYGNADSGRP
jgi:hypothetical protein